MFHPIALAVGFYHFPITAMKLLKRRFWLYSRQVDDMRVRLLCKKTVGGREFVVVFDKRVGWIWKPYAKIKFLDLLKIRILQKNVETYLESYFRGN